MMKEKLNLQNTIKALEHQFVQVELKDDADNDKRERIGSKRTSNWMSDMFLVSPIKDEAESKVTASKSPKKSSSPPPVINVDKDASQAEILKQTIIAPHKQDDTFGARITGIFSIPGSTDAEYYPRMSDLSETSPGSSPPSGNRGSNQTSLSLGTTQLAALREVLELIYGKEARKEKEDHYRTDHSIVVFDEGRDSWSDEGDSIMVGSSLFGMDANDSARNSGSSNQAKLLASAINHKKETSRHHS
jgi:hypothetical protein